MTDSPSSRFRPPGTVLGYQVIFIMEIPYGKYFLGPGNIPGGRIARAGTKPGKYVLNWRWDVRLAARAKSQPIYIRPEPEIHRVFPESGSTLRRLIRDFQSNFWFNSRILGQPCDFTFSLADTVPRLQCEETAQVWQSCSDVEITA